MREQFSPTQSEKLDHEDARVHDPGEIEPPKKRATLGAIRAAARCLAMAGLGLASTAQVDVHAGEQALYELEGHYTEQFTHLEQLEAKEARLKNLFGDLYYRTARFDRKKIEEERAAFRTADNPENVPKAAVTVREPWNNPETSKIWTAIEDLPTREGTIRTEELEDLTLNAYPSAWMHEVDSMRFKDTKADMRYSRKNTKGINFVSLAHCIGGDGSQKSKIVFYEGARKTGMKYMMGAVGHEIAHASDWRTDRTATSEERADIALALIERIGAPDRFTSSYVEQIAHEDPQTQLWQKTLEYWAEIASQYLQDASKLHIKDFLLVNGWVQRTDPGFNWKAANERHAQLIADKLKNQKHADRR